MGLLFLTLQMRTLGLRGPQDQAEEPGLVLGLDQLCSCPNAITAILAGGPPPPSSHPSTAAWQCGPGNPQPFHHHLPAPGRGLELHFSPCPSSGLGAPQSTCSCRHCHSAPPTHKRQSPTPSHDSSMEHFFNVLFLFMHSPISSLQLLQKVGQVYQVSGLRDGRVTGRG